MLDAVLSPNQSGNQVLGGISSPNGEGLRKVSNPSPAMDHENSASPGDKENAAGNTLEVDPIEKDEYMMEDSVEEESTASSPKRAAEETPEESPESISKKARINDDIVDAVEDEGATASPPKTSSSSKSVDDLLADLGKAKSALQQSKDTLKLLKEHQQKLAENGASMTSRVEAFDAELTKLKETHEENGKELEKVKSIRDRAKEAFEAAESTLRKISAEKKSNEEGSFKSKVGSEENKEKDAVEVEAKEDTKDDDGEAEAEMAPTEEIAEILTSPKHVVEDAKTPTSAVKEEIEAEAEEVKDSYSPSSTVTEEIEAEAEEVKDWHSPSSAVKEEIDTEEIEAVVKDMPSPSGSVKDEAVATDELVQAESTESTPFDENEIEEAKNTLDSIGTGSTDDSEPQLELGHEITSCTGDSKSCADSEIQVKASSSSTIDDTLALELQNSDDSDDDLLS